MAKNDSVMVKVLINFSRHPEKTPDGASIPKSFTKIIQLYEEGSVFVYKFPNAIPEKDFESYLKWKR